MKESSSGISRDEATTLIADNLKSVTENMARLRVMFMLAPPFPAAPGDKMARRLLNLTGGYLESYHSVSMGNTAAATRLILTALPPAAVRWIRFGDQTGDSVGP